MGYHLIMFVYRRFIIRERSPNDRKVITRWKFAYIDLCNIRIICQVQLS